MDQINTKNEIVSQENLKDLKLLEATRNDEHVALEKYMKYKKIGEKILKYRKILILLIVILGIVSAQNVNRFGRQQETALEFSTMDKKKDLFDKSKKSQTLQPQNLLVTPIEKAIDPEAYLVGPGDQFGININSIENLNFVVYVGPAGDILIPTVGVVNVNGQSLTKAIEFIKKFILTEGYKTADVYVSLVNVRKFKIQITGAVNRPGFYVVTPLTRLDEIIEMANGFHNFAKEFAVEISKADKIEQTIDYIEYMSSGSIENNPHFTDDTKIFIPFGDLEKEGVAIRGSIDNSGYDIIKEGETLGNFINRKAVFMETVDLESISITRNDEVITVQPVELFSTLLQAGDIIDISTEKGVSVNGFVQVPGSYKFFPGYTCADYIGLAGGNSLEGNVKRAIIKHVDGTVEKGPDVIIRRGDLIIVPRSLTQWLVGNSSIFQITASLAGIVLSYLAATK